MSLSPEYLEIKRLLGEAQLDHRQVNFRLMCISRGWRYIRLATGDEYNWAYRDVEPSPLFEGKGGRVHAGTLIFYDPNPAPGGHHHQLWSGEPLDYTRNLGESLSLAKKLAPLATIVIYASANPATTPTACLQLNEPFKSIEEWNSGKCINEAHAVLSAVFNYFEAMNK